MVTFIPVQSAQMVPVTPVTFAAQPSASPTPVLQAGPTSDQFTKSEANPLGIAKSRKELEEDRKDAEFFGEDFVEAFDDPFFRDEDEVEAAEKEVAQTQATPVAGTTFVPVATAPVAQPSVTPVGPNVFDPNRQNAASEFLANQGLGLDPSSFVQNLPTDDLARLKGEELFRITGQQFTNGNPFEVLNNFKQSQSDTLGSLGLGSTDLQQAINLGLGNPADLLDQITNLI